MLQSVRCVCLKSLYIGQEIRKWVSSSSSFLQNVHILSVLSSGSVSVYRPVSMFRLWLESRSLVKAVLCLMSVMSERYLSALISVLTLL